MATSPQTEPRARDFDDTKVSSPSPSHTTRGSVAARVTAHILDALQHGVRPWVQPWNSATALALPLRHNGIAYKGANVLALWCAARTHNFSSRYWLTFKQALALGGAVRRGEHGQPVIFYSDGATAEDGEGDASPPRRAVLRAYVCFCADQIAGLPVHFYAPAIAPPANNDADLVTRFARVPALVEHGGA
jgi:antirestriction protein ArdC